MRKLLFPTLIAAIFLAVSVSLIFYGWHLISTLPFPRTGPQVIQILGVLAISLFLLTGSAGYLLAVPGLEMGENGFRPSNTRYGKLVGRIIGETKTTCGVGYVVGLNVLGVLSLVFVAFLFMVLLYAFIDATYQTAVNSPLVLMQTIGLVVAIFVSVFVGWFAFRGAAKLLTNHSFYERICPPREFR
jgi:hypothetical protein